MSITQFNRYNPNVNLPRPPRNDLVGDDDDDDDDDDIIIVDNPALKENENNSINADVPALRDDDDIIVEVNSNVVPIPNKPLLKRPIKESKATKIRELVSSQRGRMQTISRLVTDGG